MKGVVGPHGLAFSNSDNGKRLVAFASAHDMAITTPCSPIRVSTEWSSNTEYEGFHTGEVETQSISVGYNMLAKEVKRAVEDGGGTVTAC